jgi:3-hydroxyacyl-CoA dehydrogenase
VPDPEVMKIAKREAKALGIRKRTVKDQEILDRLLLSMINEGAKVLEEGIALRPGDIDVIFVNGYGFPRWRGGPMFHADVLGPRKVLAGIERLRKRFGDQYWTPAPLLKKIVADRLNFTKWSTGRNSG